jgi:hypothetical protein
MKSDDPRKSHRRPVPEARVTGRPRLVVGRAAGVPEVTDMAAYGLVTLALATIVVLPAVLGRFS